MNRAIARRPLFEDERDLRFFLSRLARERRRGRLEVHAWCLMTTHFHLLVRSPTGEMGEAMRRVQNEYVRQFNRRHRRDGTLVRGRFKSKRVRSLRYRNVLVRYIDMNPVDAHMCATPSEYPWGSAADHIRTRSRPWLADDWIGQAVQARMEPGISKIDAYYACFPPHVSDASRTMIESSIEATGPAMHSAVDLVLDAPSGILEWMQRKTHLADGSPLGIRLADPSTVRHLVKDYLDHGLWEEALPQGGEARRTLLPAAVRILSGATWSEVSMATGIPRSTAQRLVAGSHCRLIQECPSYGRAFQELACSLVQRILS